MCGKGVQPSFAVCFIGPVIFKDSGREGRCFVSTPTLNLSFANMVRIPIKFSFRIQLCFISDTATADAKWRVKVVATPRQSQGRLHFSPHPTGVFL